MGFLLVAEAGGVLKIKAWQWKPIVELAGRAGIVDHETLERMSYNANASISAAQAGQLAAPNSRAAGRHALELGVRSPERGLDGLSPTILDDMVPAGR